MVAWTGDGRRRPVFALLEGVEDGRAQDETEVCGLRTSLSCVASAVVWLVP